MARSPDRSIMRQAGHRQERLADQIRMEVAEMIGGELKDPRIGFATVSRVELSPDMRHSRVFVSIMGDTTQTKETLSGLASATGYIRHELSVRLRLKRTPELEIVLDHSSQDDERVAQLLKELKSGSEH